ncbi:YggS family pyridoxal phosphate-dependent enzyme [Candidatus Auribacterota bacterium]
MPIKQNLESIKHNIADAAIRSGRRPEDITLCAITKTVDVDPINELIDCGVDNIGESKIQDALRKYPNVKEGIAWHLVGHLQTNKAKEAVKLFDHIHSVDSVKLASHISRRAGEIGKSVKILIEVNVAEEETKYGLNISEVEPALREMAKLESIEIVGLMTMAPYIDAEETRPYFRKLRELKDALNAKNINGLHLNQLSMGMTNDYVVAIEEGATIVRIGTALFE